MRLHGIDDQTRTIRQLLAWADTYRQPLSETPLGKASNQRALVRDTEPYRKRLSRCLPLEDYAMPILRVVSDTYRCHDFPHPVRPEDIVGFLKTLQTALNQPSLKKAVDHHQRRQRKALENAIKKLKADFQQHRCLRVIHILLLKDPRSSPPTTLAESNLQFLTYRQAFFAACHTGREPGFANLVRYYWRQFADDMGNLHLWMIFTFAPTTASSLRDLPLLQHVDQIGQCWRETITQGWGAALTRNADTVRTHRSTQLGGVCRDDAQAIVRLQRLMYTLEALSVFESHQAQPNKKDKLSQPRSQGNGKGRAAKVED